jgi:hypothetical protein
LEYLVGNIPDLVNIYVLLDYYGIVGTVACNSEVEDMVVVSDYFVVMVKNLSFLNLADGFLGKPHPSTDLISTLQIPFDSEEEHYYFAMFPHSDASERKQHSSHQCF